MDALFYALFSGGRHSMHYLIQFSHQNLGTIRLVNNNEDVAYDGKTFARSSFEYTEPDKKGAGGALRITAIGNELIPFIENADDKYRLDVVGVLVEDGEVQPIESYAHFHGSASYSDDMVVEFQLEGDDRLDMTFTPYMYDTDSNRGNA